MRGQITIDFLFAITLVAITTMGLVSFGNHARLQADVIGQQANLRVLAITARDDVAKVYSAGPGFTLVENVPFRLGPGDNVLVTLNETSDSVVVTGDFGGNVYRTEMKLQVPLVNTTSVTLTSQRTGFNLTAVSVGGVTSVELR